LFFKEKNLRYGYRSVLLTVSQEVTGDAGANESVVLAL